MALGRLSIDLEANIARFESDMGRASRVAEKEARQMRRNIERIGTAVGAATAAAAAGLAAVVRTVTQTADQMAKLEDRLGVSTEAMSQLAYAAELSGVGFNTLELGLQRMTRRIGEVALLGKGEAKQALEILGLEAEKLVNLPLDQQFEAIADELSKVQNASERTSLAMKIFDSEGVRLVQIMGEGAEGIRQMREEADRFNLTISQELANNAEQFNNNLAAMGAIAQGAARTFVDGLLPSLLDLQGVLIENATGANDFRAAGEWLGETFKKVAQIFVLFKGILEGVGAVIVGTVSAVIKGVETIVRPLDAAINAVGLALRRLTQRDFAGAREAIASIPSDWSTAWARADKEMRDAIGFIPERLKEIEKETRDAFGELTKQSAKAEQPVRRTGEAVESLSTSTAELAESTEAAVDAGEDIDALLDRLIEQYEDAEREARAFADRVQDIVDIFYPLQAEGRRVGDMLADLTRGLEKGLITQEQYDHIVRMAVQGLEEFAGGLRETEQEVDTLAAAVDEGARILERAFQDMWEGLLSGAEDVFDQILDGFRSLIAQLIHESTTRSIILNIQSALNGEKPLDFAQLGGDIAQLAGVILGQQLGGGGQIAGIGSALGGVIGEKLGEKFLTTVLGSLGSLSGPLGSILGALLGGALGSLFDRDLEFSLGGANIQRAADAQRIRTPLGEIFGIRGQGGAGSLNDLSTPLGQLAAALQEFDTQIAKVLSSVVDDETFAQITASLENWVGVWGENAEAADVLQSRFGVILSNFTGDIQQFVRGAQDFEDQLDRFGVALAAENLIQDNPEIFSGTSTAQLLNLVAAFKSGAETMTDAFNEFLALANRVIAAQTALRDFADSNALDDFIASLDVSLAQALAGVNQALLDAIANFDGSIESLEEIASLSLLVREGEIRLLSQIDQIQKGLNANLEALRNEILGTTSGELTGAQIFNQAQDLIGQLGLARTAQDVAGLEQQFSNLIRSISPEDQAFMQSEIVAIIDLFRERANQVIDAQRQDVLDNAATVREAVDRFILEVGDPLDIIAASLEGDNIPQVIDEGLNQIDATVATIGPQVAQALRDGLSEFQVTVIVQDQGLANQ